MIKKLGSNEISYRLPSELMPFSYEITIRPYIGSSVEYGVEKSFKFDGNITIGFTCSNPTSKIVLHIKDLLIKNESIKLHSHSTYDTIEVSQKWSNDFKREFMILNMNKECTKNQNYSVNMLYVGHIFEYLAGFYRSSYTSSDGKIN